MDLLIPHIAIDFTTLGLSREIISIGPLALRWYSMAYIVGILLAWAWVLRLLRRPGAPATREHIDALVTWATLGVIAGGRLAYVIFYDPARFAAHPLDIVKLWEGGMAFHGGAAGVALAILLYCRSQGLNSLRVGDYIACAAPIGLFLGRIANFINGELWGRPTGSDWGVIFPGAGAAPRHPSQLYEAALEGVLLFAILNALFWGTAARHRPGLLSGVFLMGYGAVRFGVEFFREPDAQLGLLALGLSMGQLLCLPMLAAGLWLIVRAPRPGVAAVPGA